VTALVRLATESDVAGQINQALSGGGKIQVRAGLTVGESLVTAMIARACAPRSSTNQRADLPQRGRNKQGRHDLRQMGLALVVDQRTRLPWRMFYMRARARIGRRSRSFSNRSVNTCWN
jgi:hypothetical protein